MKKVALVLAVALLLTGCAASVIFADNDQEYNSREVPVPGELTPAQFDQLREQDVYVMSAGPVDGKLHVNVLRPNQQVVQKVQAIVGEDVVITEAEEWFVIRGEITKIVSDDNDRVIIFVENDEESPDDKAYILKNDYTIIEKPSIRHGQEVARILSADELATGQTVEVQGVGAFLLSYPPKGSVGTIRYC
ncbi:MAG: hypothetical protein FH749_06375 [Firmicutes bacterium]|nr:hypothetical protein [Bacillota bacterium]